MKRNKSWNRCCGKLWKHMWRWELQPSRGWNIGGTANVSEHINTNCKLSRLDMNSRLDTRMRADDAREFKGGHLRHTTWDSKQTWVKWRNLIESFGIWPSRLQGCKPTGPSQHHLLKHSLNILQRRCRVELKCMTMTGCLRRNGQADRRYQVLSSRAKQCWRLCNQLIQVSRWMGYQTSCWRNVLKIYTSLSPYYSDTYVAQACSLRDGKLDGSRHCIREGQSQYRNNTDQCKCSRILKVCLRQSYNLNWSSFWWNSCHLHNLDSSNDVEPKTMVLCWCWWSFKLSKEAMRFCWFRLTSPERLTKFGMLVCWRNSKLQGWSGGRSS